MSNTEKVRENRLRMMADRQGLRLLKSRTRDPNALTFGGYQLVDLQNGGCVCGWGNAGYGYAASLDDVEEYLSPAKPTTKVAVKITKPTQTGARRKGKK